MGWRHYEVRSSGKALIVKDRAPIAAAYQMGIISTGRSRVFAGHFFRATLPSGTEFSGEDEHSLRSALQKLARSLAAVDLELRCVGLDLDFSESGLSVDTGFGYSPRSNEPVHMMDVMPEWCDNQALSIDGLIRDSVEKMRIGMPGRRSPTRG